jgi:hypothetical protein
MIHGALRDGRRRAANARPTRFAFLCSRPTAWPSRQFTTLPAQGATPSASANLNAVNVPRNINRSKLARKKATESPDTHRRLQICLPPHLRSNAIGGVGSEEPFIPSAPETAKLLLEAYSQREHLIRRLAVEEGQWRAAVWIVKLLVEYFHKKPSRADDLSATVQDWNRVGSLDDLTRNPLYPKPRSGESFSPHIRTSSSASLHELTDGNHTISPSELLRHEILGLVWGDIGNLIIACSSNHDVAGGEVKSEVLEMIALLHHYELMPESIYSYTPVQSVDTVQQPPTLHLLSRRIFTALSDATWRAREVSALEEAKRKGGELMGLEAKGSSYRVRVSGIKPEIWLELVLWSCLHGGWINQGAALLHSVHNQKAHGEYWSPISWRDSLNAVMPFGKDDLVDWDSISYIFDTRSNATMDGVDITGLRVDKTVSSEVVNAYIDAVLDSVDVGVGKRGLDLQAVINRLRTLRKFLLRAKLNLGGGTWDAMVLRLVDSGGIDIDRDTAIVPQLVALYPRMGDEFQLRRSQAVPSYVLDGSAAILGLFHRALYAEIKNSNLEGALKVFKHLQERVDNDRYQSLSDFFAHKHLSLAREGDASKGLFTSNFSGIDYPSFSTQIPPKTLAAFLELVIANKSFALGNWMLGIDNNDIDGPLIPASLYPDPHISAAVVHYATVTNNTSLLSKITKLGAVQVEEGSGHEPTLPNQLMQAFLDAQIGLRRWDAAEKILEYVRDTKGFDWNVGNVATLAKAMIVERQDATNTDQKTTLTRARQLFASLLAGTYGVTKRSSVKQQSVNTLCVVLATVSPALAAVVRENNALPKHFEFTLRAGAFNSILEGVVATLGSDAGRALVDRFALVENQNQNQNHEKPGEEIDDENNRTPSTSSTPRVPRFMRDALVAYSLSRTNISITCASGKAHYIHNVTMYGRFNTLTPTTIRTIVRQALIEHTSTPRPETLAWALFALRRARLEQTSIRNELVESGLTDNEVRNVEQRAREMWEAKVSGNSVEKDS